MAGVEFNLNVNGPEDSDGISKPVDPTKEEITGDLPDLGEQTEKLNKARVRLDKQIRDFDYQMQTLENRLKSQVVNLGAMASQRARSAKDEQKLDEVLEQILAKQKARLAFIETTLEKSYDTIETKLKLNKETEEADKDTIQSSKDRIDKELDQADQRILDELDKLKEVSLKDIKARQEEKLRKQKELDAKREARRKDFEDRKKARAREKQALSSAKQEGKRVEQETLESLSRDQDPLNQLADFVEDFFGLGRFGVSSKFKRNNRDSIRQRAKEAGQKAYQSSLAQNLPVPPSGTQAGPSPVPPPQGPSTPQPPPKPPGSNIPLPPIPSGGGGAGGAAGGVAGVAAGIAISLTIAKILNDKLDEVVEHINKRISSVADFAEGASPASVFRSYTSNLPMDPLSRKLVTVQEQLIDTLDRITLSAEKDIRGFSPEVIQANIEKSLSIMEQSMGRADTIGSLVASIIKERTDLEQQTKLFADAFLDLFGPLLRAMISSLTRLVQIGTSVLAIADEISDGLGEAFSEGKFYQLINPSFWYNAIREGIKRAVTGNNIAANNALGAPLENFFGARDTNNPASPLNPGGKGVSIK